MYETGPEARDCVPLTSAPCGLAVDNLDDRVAHRLHEAVDQRGCQRRAGGRVDASGGDKTVFLRPQEALLPQGAVFFDFGGGQRIGDAATYVMNVGFAAFGIFFDQDFAGNFLLGKRSRSRRVSDGGKAQLLRILVHFHSPPFL